VDYFSIVTTDKPGEGARMLPYLKDAGVNLAVVHAFSGRPKNAGGRCARER
jgi:hypothetical protein